MFTAVVYSRYDKYPYNALSLSRRARNHRRRRAGVSHGTDHYERGGESHDHDRQRVEHHHQMRPARQWHPPAGRLRQKPARHQRGARGCVLDDDRRQRGAAALRPTRVRPAFSCRTTPAQRCILVADLDRCGRVHGEQPHRSLQRRLSLRPRAERRWLNRHLSAARGSRGARVQLAAGTGRLLQADAARVSARPCSPGRRVPRAAGHESALR
jgi:hypothetical protein